MFSRMSATFFNKTLPRIQKRGYIDEMHAISNICYTVEAGKICEAKQLIAQFSNESGKTYHNMLKMVIDTATKCDRLDLAKEVERTVLKFNA